MRFVKTLDNISGLPFGYTEVEYLEADGNQYINTGYSPGLKAGTFTFDVGVKNTYAQSGRGAIGSRSVDNGRNWVIASSVNEGITFQQFGYGNTYANINSNSSGKYQRLRSYLTDTEYVIDARMDGSVYSSSFTIQTFTNTANVYLFGINNKGSLFSSFPFVGQMYYAKMYQDGVLVRDYIPCLDPLGVPCMYDKIGRKPYYNVGTGSFTYGHQIIPVKYIRTTGVQYINTGYRPHSETVVETKFKMNESTTDNFKWIFLARNNTVAGDGYGFGCNGTGYITSDYNNRVSGDQRFVAGTTYTLVKNKNICKVNDTVLTNTVSTFVVNYPLYMFTLNDHGNVASTTTLPSLDCYYFKISDQNGVMRDYIPVRDENNVGYMFDRVSHFLFGNTGGGELGIGEDIYAHKLRLIKDVGELPMGYKRLDYIQTSGTQYIDTGVVAKSGLSSVLNFEYTDVSTTFSMLDARSGNNRFYLCHCGKPSSTAYFYYGYGSAVQSSTTPAVNTRYLVETSLAVGSQSMKVNGTTIASGSDSTSYNLGVNLYLFAMNYSTPQYLAKVKLYCCKIMDGSTLVRDYVPCLDPKGTPCLFDKVSRKPYYNAGTGVFTYGHILIPVEYLESTGTQYINTGVTGNNNTKIDILFSKKNTSAYYINGIIGARGNTVNTNNVVVGINGHQIAIDFVNGGSNSYATYRYIASDTLVDVKYRAIVSKTERSLYQGNTFIGQNATLSSQTINTTNLWMFGVQNYGFTEAKIYHCKIYDNDVLVRDLIPVRDENNVGYMLDRVYGTVYANAGTGSFVLGKDYPKQSVRIINSVFPDYEIGEYIQSSGTQYIDTGVNADSNLNLDFKYSLSNTSSVSRFGAINSNGVIRHHIQCNNSPNIEYFASVNTSSPSISVSTDTNPHNLKVDVLNGKAVYDGTSYNFTNTVSSFNCGMNYWLFKRNSNDTSIQTGFSGRIYYFKMYVSGVLVRNLLPAKRKSDNEIGMLDIVNKVFYTNLGSGSFTFQPKG